MYAGLRAEQVEVDLDDVLAFLLHNKWGTVEVAVISSVLRQHIRSMRRVWP